MGVSSPPACMHFFLFFIYCVFKFYIFLKFLLRGSCSIKMVTLYCLSVLIKFSDFPPVVFTSWEGFFFWFIKLF